MQNKTLLQRSITFIENPIFIGGSGRCGTTLLLNILDKHPNLYSINQETNLFVNYRTNIFNCLDELEKIQNYKMLILSMLALMLYGGESSLSLTRNNRFPIDLYKIYNEIAQINDLKTIKSKFEAFDICASFLTIRENKKRWIEKTPQNIKSFKAIFPKYPKAKIINIYRDPRAVYNSWSNTDIRFFKNSNIIECINRWNEAVNYSEEIRNDFPEHLFDIKYESLIENPKEELKKLCTFLEEDFSLTMLEVVTYNSSFEDARHKEGFNSASIYRWQKSLTNNELILIDDMTRKNRIKLGYSDSEIYCPKFNFSYNVFYLRKRFIEGKNHLRVVQALLTVCESLINSFQTFLYFISNVLNLLNAYLIDINKLLTKLIFSVKNVNNKYKKIYWLIIRKKRIINYLAFHPIKKLHIKANKLLPEWLNTNFIPRLKEDIMLEPGKKFPFKDKSFDYVFVSNQVEYLDLEHGKRMFSECFRILKSKGILRIATLDLEPVIESYINNHDSINNKKSFLINHVFKDLKYKFIYDYNTIKELMSAIGFIDIKRCLPDKSEYLNLTNLESKTKLLKADGGTLENIIIEASHP